MESRKWIGKAVAVEPKGLGGIFSNKPLRVDLTEDAARKLALSLARLKQTTFALQEEVEELLTALNYVLVADPDSVAKHKRMEAGKGMEPSGG